MNPTRTKPALPSRERRVGKIVWGVIAVTLVNVLVGVVVAVMRSRSQGSHYDFLSGILVGLFGVMPFGVALLMAAAYRQMDEYGQRLQEKACTFAFVMTMLAASASYMIASGMQTDIPLWTIPVFGSVVYSLALLRGSLAARGGRE